MDELVFSALQNERERGVAGEGDGWRSMTFHFIHMQGKKIGRW